MPPPPLTPEEQLQAEIQNNSSGSDLYNRINLNGRAPEYAKIEIQRRNAAAQVSKIESDMAPNSPLRMQIWKQAEAQTNQDYPGMVGQKTWLDQRDKNFQTIFNPLVQAQRGVWQSQTGLVESMQKQLSEFSAPKLLADEEGERLTGYKMGLNTVDRMTQNYTDLLKQAPQLGNAFTGKWAGEMATFLNDPHIKPYLNTSPLLQSYYAKNIGSESGKLSNQGMELAKPGMPVAGDSAEVAQQKGMLFIQFLQSEYNGSLKGFQDMGKRTGNFLPVDATKPETYSTAPRTDMGTGAAQTPDPLQNPTIPSAQATPSPSPNMPDYAKSTQSQIDNFLMGNSKQQQATAQAQAQNAQKAQAAQQQAAAQQAQQQAAAAQQQGVQAQQQGAQAAQQAMPPGLPMSD